MQLSQWFSSSQDSEICILNFFETMEIDSMAGIDIRLAISPKLYIFFL